MFTPRSVTMGNKVFKVNVKYSSKSCEIQLNQDDTIYALKLKIQKEFNLDPSLQVLQCNGKILDLDDNTTIKQARIPNGSKILCSSLKSASPKVSNSVIDKLLKIEKDADEIEKKLDVLKKSREENICPSLFSETSHTQELKKIKFECKKGGEELMRLLESLDSISCNDTEERLRRKKVATKINAILDKSDRLGGKLEKDLKT